MELSKDIEQVLIWMVAGADVLERADMSNEDDIQIGGTFIPKKDVRALLDDGVLVNRLQLSDKGKAVALRLFAIREANTWFKREMADHPLRQAIAAQIRDFDALASSNEKLYKFAVSMLKELCQLMVYTGQTLAPPDAGEWNYPSCTTLHYDIGGLISDPNPLRIAVEIYREAMHLKGKAIWISTPKINFAADQCITCYISKKEKTPASSEESEDGAGMIIGGRDIVLPFTFGPAEREKLVATIKDIWPDAVWQGYDDDSVVDPSSLSDSNEFFIYENMAVFDVWEAGGVHPHMIHVLIGEASTTLVIDDAKDSSGMAIVNALLGRIKQGR